jgi:hypothetical protein
MRTRPEVTGLSAGTRAAPRAGKNVAEFCAAYDISRSTFDNWQRRGVGPVVLQPVPGGRKLITDIAEKAWLRERAGLNPAAE